MITFQGIDVEVPKFLGKSVIKWIEQVISSHHKKTGEVFFLFCSDSYLLAMNQEFLNHDTYTDIITFDTSTESTIISGELYISLDRVRENALKLDQIFENEVYRVMIHGILHLIGFGDKLLDDAKEMRKQENISLSLQALSTENQ